jgi:hypothetical protein
MNKRKDHIARVDRKVLPRHEIYTTDLWGERQVNLKWCKYHKRYEDPRLFFVESASKRKHEYQLRNMCIEAWELTNGKINFTAEDTTPPPLCLFMKD